MFSLNSLNYPKQKLNKTQLVFDLLIKVVFTLVNYKELPAFIDRN